MAALRLRMLHGVFRPVVFRLSSQTPASIVSQVCAEATRDFQTQRPELLSDRGIENDGDSESTYHYRFRKSLPSLPAVFTLEFTLEAVHVDNLLPKDVPDAFQLVQDGVRRSDNVGTEEFPTLDDFQELYKSGSMFGVRDIDTDQLKSVIAIQPCKLSRSINPYLATIYVLTSSDMSHRLAWRDLARLAQRFAVDLQVGYGGCVTGIFFRCVERVLAFREEGFTITASIYDAGKLASSETYLHSYVLYKDFGLGIPQKLTLECTRKLADHVCSREEPFEPKQVAFLPREYVLEDGRRTLLRTMRSNEVDLCFSMYDQKFGIDELPTKRFFIEKNLRYSLTVVIEDRETGKWIAVMNIVPSEYTRCKVSRLGDGFLIVTEEYIGRKYGNELYGVMIWIIGQLGYKGILGDSDVANVPSLSLFYKYNCVNTGVIPRSVYKPNRGWLDVAIFYKSFQQSQSCTIGPLE